jgi:hypothetical protein
MFFMNLAEKSGLTGLLAPKKRKKDDSPEDGSSKAKANTPAAVAAAAAADSAVTPSAQELELENKKRLLESQKDREIKGAASSTATRNCFVKNQRVFYFHKASDTWFDDAYIVGVHHDDGVDQPYYTIRYYKNNDSTLEAQLQEPIEKQTTHDRLKYAAWDQDKTWAILSKRW